jgi:prepilin-type N-terminal cleavage/methylation domain-containing protein/prepilin-type processing-associated H-X9-DG protein
MKRGFTLIELMVVVAIIGVIISIMLPVISAAREASRSSYCQNNLRQLYLANDLYSIDNGYYVAAAPDMMSSSNKKRWHGEKDPATGMYDGSKSPLAPYLGESGRVRQCPSFHDFRQDKGGNAFESSAGGYGYNEIGVGSRVYREGMRSSAMKYGMLPSVIMNPGETVMFTDAALAQPYGNPKYLIEYSFAHAYHWVYQAGKESSQRVQYPSIHFRHHKKANVVWCDGHVSSERMTVKVEKKFSDMNLGWFGEANNKLFDPY